MPRLRLDAAPSNLMLENRNNTLKAKSTTSGLVVQKAQGPSLRPRAILGDLTKATAVTVNQVKNEQPEDKIKKPTMGIAAKKPLQSTIVKKVVPVAAPKAVVCTKQAEPEAYSSKQLPIEDIDLDRDNPQLVSYYAKDIYSYLRQLEKSYTIGAHYMDYGYIIRPTMRTILVDWLVDVHGRFKMLQETLYLSVSVMDSFLQVDSTVNRKELQLVGLTAMLIAAKFEETWAPEINDFVYMSDKAYTSKEVLAMECRMLQKLDFRLGRPLPLHFLRRNTQAASQILDQVDVLHHTLSKYLMELTLPEYSFCHYLPSELAAAALCLSLRILDENDMDGSKLWNHSMVYYSGYTYESLEPLMGKLCGLIASADVSKFQAVRKKYACSKLYNISTIPHLKSTLVTVLAKRSASIKN